MACQLTCSQCQLLLPPEKCKSLRIEIKLPTLKKSAESCSYCKLLHDAYERYIISVDAKTVIVECSWGQPIVMTFDDTMNDHFSSWYLLYKPQGSHIPSWPSLGGPETVPDDFGSKRSIQFVKEHMKACMSGFGGDHKACQQLRQAPLPKRVLEVRGNTVKLRETDNQHGDYCALSYRWGPPEHNLKTLKLNADSMMSGIEWSSLPLALQDAITLTRRLEIPFIWIDALCIIQDDREDWETEAPKMGQYYRHAILTISASSADTVAQSFLVQRQPIDEKVLESFTFIGPDQSEFPIIGRRIPDFAGIPLTASSPLSSRAWTWQENVLSTRIAHFTKSEIIWECRSQQAFENGARLQCPAGLAFRFARAADDPEYYWKALVMEYSKRDLTKESDRLPAISSVAADFAKMNPGRYLAGIWEKWIFSDLAWASVWGYQNQFPPATLPPGEMPSWSWASVVGQVYHRLQVCVESSKLAAVKLIHAECDAAGANPYGPPKEGSYLLVEAPAFTAELHCRNVLQLNDYQLDTNPNSGRPTIRSLLKIGKDQDREFIFNPDTVILSDGFADTPQGKLQCARRASKDERQGATSLKMNVYCLHLGGGRYPKPPSTKFPSIPAYQRQHFWLVLSPVPEQSGPYMTFRRLGLLQRSDGKRYPSKTMQVKLV